MNIVKLLIKCKKIEKLQTKHDEFNRKMELYALENDLVNKLNMENRIYVAEQFVNFAKKTLKELNINEKI